MKTFRQIICLLLCFALTSVIAIRMQGRWLGIDVNDEDQERQLEQVTHGDTLQYLPDGTNVINTTFLARDVHGYAGNVPLEIRIKSNSIIDIRILANSETPDFLASAATLLEQWKGQSVDNALTQKVDAVTGATFSSNAIIVNLKRGLEFYQKAERVTPTQEVRGNDAKAITATIVLLFAAIVPLFTRSKKYRLFQLMLNVGILGLWCGALLSYSSILNFIANGPQLGSIMVSVLAIVIAFVYPLFGRRSYYCTHVCPYGSAQALMAKCTKRKIKLGTRTVRALHIFRKVLWIVLMMSLLTGIGSSWINYEPFSAFIFMSSSVTAIVVAVLFLLISLVIPRPYCRFICPVGSLLRICQWRGRKL